jgi:hypothetical protein
MPARSSKQRKAAGAVLACKRGKRECKGTSKKMAKSMSTQELKKYASKKGK